MKNPLVVDGCALPSYPRKADASRYGGTYAHPDKEGNIRDEATLEQLVVLSNLESINALLIRQGLSQADRLVELNKTAIPQMKTLVAHQIKLTR